MPSAPKPQKPPKSRKARTAKPDPDKWFSLCVRERADWTCESCGKKYEPWYTAEGLPANPGLHCSHYIGRANYAVRFHPMNANAHCYHCHSKFEGNPHEFQTWKRAQIGNEKYELLVALSNESGKPARQAKKEIELHYRMAFSAMLSLRNEFVGYLEFPGWTPEPANIAEAIESIGA